MLSKNKKERKDYLFSLIHEVYNNQKNLDKSTKEVLLKAALDLENGEDADFVSSKLASAVATELNVQKNNAIEELTKLVFFTKERREKYLMWLNF